MLLFPPCKINIGLYITGRRADGYHNLETCFLPVPWHDGLELLPMSIQQQPVFTQSGLSVNGPPESNICLKAWQLMHRHFPELPVFQIHLHKVIPMGAGLGGGSADGAYVLRAINELAGLQLSQQQLIDLALELGSDCPFFTYNEPCLGYGRGEILEPIALPLDQWQLVLINPGIHISTAWAFSRITPRQASIDLQDLAHWPVESWQHQVENHFQEAVCREYPAVADWIHWLQQHGAVYAAMSGSGSTVFGLFPPDSLLPVLPEAPNLVTYQCRLPSGA